MYKLIGAPGSGSVLLEAMLEWAGAPYSLSVVAPWEPGADLGRLRELNPLMQVPILILPDKTVLTESAAMVLHLADRFPEAGLVPEPDDPARPVFFRWLAFIVANIYPTFTVGDHPDRWVSGEGPQAELRRRTDAYRQNLWRLAEDQTAADPWFLGQRFSALDLYVAVMTRWRPRRAWFAENCPRLHGIAAAVEADPRFAPVFARNFPPAASGQ